jgi:hypothetical protein
VAIFLAAALLQVIQGALVFEPCDLAQIFPNPGWRFFQFQIVRRQGK